MLTRCERGHFFDADQHASCPFCTAQTAAGVTMPIGATMPVGSSAPVGSTTPIGVTVPVGSPSSGADAAKTQRGGGASNVTRSGYTANNEEGVTIVGARNKIGIDPIVGWLVCIDGKDKGRDYKIHTGNNFIGRDESMDICIRGDNSISRVKHACITYDDKHNQYYLMPGDARGLVYLNNQSVFSAQELDSYDIVELGESRLLFIKLCCDKFKWVESNRGNGDE